MSNEKNIDKTFKIAVARDSLRVGMTEDGKCFPNSTTYRNIVNVEVYINYLKK